MDGESERLGRDDILIVAPYNAQVRLSNRTGSNLSLEPTLRQVAANRLASAFAMIGDRIRHESDYCVGVTFAQLAF